MTTLLPCLRRIAQEDIPDAELLRAFLVDRDERAFTTIVRRHGPMVLGVCQRVLRDPHDAEDACQATFLVLVRKGQSLRQPEQLASWLYGVAYRTALDSRRPPGRQLSEAELAGRMREEPIAELVWQELRLILDEELQRLPARYRLPLVLCFLEGKSNRAAARLLGWPEGTIATRIFKAKQLLRQQLTRRGLTLSAGVVSAALTQGLAVGSMPPLLVSSTVKAALLLQAGGTLAGVLSIKVIALMEGTVQAMLWTKMKLMAVVVLVAVGTGTMVFQASGQQKGGNSQEDLRRRVQEMRAERETLKQRLQAVEDRIQQSEKGLNTDQEKALAALNAALNQVRRSFQAEATKKQSLQELNDATKRLEAVVKKLQGNVPLAATSSEQDPAKQLITFALDPKSLVEVTGTVNDVSLIQELKVGETKDPASHQVSDTALYVRHVAAAGQTLVKAIGEDGLVLIQVGEKTEFHPGQTVVVAHNTKDSVTPVTVSILFQKDRLAVGKLVKDGLILDASSSTRKK